MKARALVVFVVLTWLAARPLPAESDAWTAVVSPTSETLWGACAGPQGFVAVGEKGTVLTSSDGLSWVTRSSGTARWLLAVAYGDGLYLAVGEGGTVLASTDAITWQPRSSGTTQRLNAVVRGGGVWVAVGEGGVVVRSVDGVAWTAGSVGESGWLRGLAFGADRFVAAGQGGSVFLSMDGARTFSRVPVATSGGLEGVAYDGGAFHVVGDAAFLASSADGAEWRRVVFRSPPPRNTFRAVASAAGWVLAAGDRTSYHEPRPPPQDRDWRALAVNTQRAVVLGAGGTIFTRLTDEHANSLVVSLPRGPYAGRPATLASKERFGPGARWQWFRDGRALAGIDGPVLEIPGLRPEDGTSFSVAVTRVDGGPAPLNASARIPPVLPNPRTLGAADSTFRPPFQHAPEVIEPLPDGRIYVADSQAFYRIGGRSQHGLARLREDGNLDPGFDVGTGLDADGAVTRFFPLDSGGVVIRGSFRTVNGSPAPGLARLRSDGSVDMAFQPDAELRDFTGLLVMLRDQRWLAVGSMADFSPTTVVRFDAQGRREATLTVPSQPLLAVKGPDRALIDDEGRVYLLGNSSRAGIAVGGFVLRLQADGTHDPSFFVQDRAIQDAAFLDGGIVLSTRTFYPSPVNWYEDGGLSKRRLTDGAVDPTFRVREWLAGAWVYNSRPPLEPPSYFGFGALTADGRGGLYALTDGHAGRVGIVRLDGRGERDPEFALELDDEQLLSFWRGLRAARDGRVLLFGTSVSPSSGAPGLVRLIPSRTAGAAGLSNLSVRAAAGTGERTLIVGYVTANGETTVLARGAGPALSAFGVPDPLADPRVAVFRGAQAVATNDDWSVGSDAAGIAAASDRLGAFAFAPGSRDSALLVRTPAGATTVHLSSADGGTGVALSELYLDGALPSATRSPRVANFSVRTHVGTGAETLIAGFTLAGEQTRTLLVRAVGPTLARFGVGNGLTEPQFTVFRGTTVVAASGQSNLGGSQYFDLLKEASRVVGAFALDTGSKDAALLTTLAPGGYTVQVSGVGGGTGVVLLEVYEIP